MQHICSNVYSQKSISTASDLNFRKPSKTHLHEPLSKEGSNSKISLLKLQQFYSFTNRDQKYAEVYMGTIALLELVKFVCA